MNYQKQNKLLTKTLSLTLLFSMIFLNVVFSNKTISAKQTDANTVINTPVLDSFTTDLTKLAKDEKLRLTKDFDKDVDQLIKSLSKSNLRQPALLDQVGESQELIVEALAARIAKNDVPENLQNKRVLMLKVGKLYSSSSNESEVADKIQKIISELVNLKSDVILFVNELTNFVGSSQVNDKFTNAILNNQIKIIGGSSKQAYIENIDSIAEVSAVFEPIMVGGGDYKGLKKGLLNESKKDRYRGDNVSAELRKMMKDNPNKREDVILQAKDANNPRLREIMAQNGIRLNDRIGSSDTMVVNLPLKAIQALADSGMANFISPDRQLTKLGHLEKTTGADFVRNMGSGNGSNSLDGSGVGIAIVDSGMHVNHKAFKDGNSSRVVYSQDFTDEGTADDNYGHGTHVAGIAASGANREAGAYKGIAPKADIINLKVLNSQGVGNTSWLLNALAWLKQNHAQYNIKVVNLSLGGHAIDTYTNDPVNLAVQDLNTEGVLVVAASGNDGKDSAGNTLYGFVHSPGNDPSVLTVGAVNTHGTDANTDDGITTFSSRGPTRSYYVDQNNEVVYDNLIKPDMVAPGNRIASAKAKATSYLPTNYPSLMESGMDIAGDDDDVISMSGTSMAAPVVAGAAALLYQLNPNLTPSMVKMILQYTAQPLAGYNMLEQGAGQLNLEGAVRLVNTYRTDIDFNSMASGSVLRPSGVDGATTTTTLNGVTFNWAKGITTDYGYIKSEYIANRFHNVYKNGMWFQKGVSNNSVTHDYYLNSNFSYTSNMNFIPKVTESNGTSLGDGSIMYAYGVYVSDGVLIADGVLVADGVLIGDRMGANGVLVGDRMGANGVLVGDRMANTNGSSIFGDQ